MNGFDYASVQRKKNRCLSGLIEKSLYLTPYKSAHLIFFRLFQLSKNLYSENPLPALEMRGNP